MRKMWMWKGRAGVLRAAVLCLVLLGILGGTPGPAAGGPAAPGEGLTAVERLGTGEGLTTGVGLETSASAPWKPETLAFDEADFQGHPSMASDSNGYLWLAFEDWTPGVSKYGMTLCVSRNGGGTWRLVRKWYSPDGHYLNPDVAVDPHTNNVYVVYEREMPGGGHDIMCHINYPDATYTTVCVDCDSGNDRYPSVASEYEFGASNRLYVSYECLNSEDDRDLMFARSASHGLTWTGQMLQGESDDRCYTETDVTCGNGVIYVAYRLSPHAVQDGSESVLSLVMSEDSGANWTWTGWSSEGKAVSHPTAAASRGGNAVVVACELWWSASNSDVVCRCSTDGGDSWGDVVTLAGSTMSETQPALTVDGMGTARTSFCCSFHVVYHREDCIYHRSAMYYDPGNWTAAEQVNDMASASYSWPGIAVTTRQARSSVPICVAWTDWRRDYDIYFSETGYPVWDISQDAVVDYKDLAILGSAYGTSEGEAGYIVEADLNGDGAVAYHDLALLGAHYGESYP